VSSLSPHNPPHVYVVVTLKSFALFFRYFESARILYLDLCGFIESYDRDKIGAILHSTGCRFRRSLFYPDTALVGARAIAVNDDRFTMAYEMVSKEQNAVVAEGDGIVVSFDYTDRRIVPIPEQVREAIEKLER
jgi:acyl-CoA thioester hydrolase